MLSLFRPNSLFKQLLLSHLAIVFISILGVGGFALYAYRTNSYDNLRHYLKVEAVEVNSALEKYRKESPEFIFDHLVTLNKAFWIIIYDQDNKLLYSSIGRHKRVDLPEKFFEKSAIVLENGMLNNYKHYMPLSEVEWYFVTRPYIDTYTNQVKGVIQLGVPMEDFHSGFLDSFSLLILLEIILSILTAFVIYYLSRRISRPLHEISEQAQSISQTGKLETQLDKEGLEELNELAESFNNMIERLKGEKQFQKEFIANASHELKTPIMAINSASEILDRKKDTIPTESHEFINILNRQSNRAQELIDALLDISVLESGKVELQSSTFSTLEFIEDCAKDIEVLAQKAGIDFSWYVADDIEISADRTKLRRAINNLLSNAIKHTPPEGEILLNARATDQHIIFSVADTGIGISEKDQIKIFERFYRTAWDRSRQTGGSGLGLAITQQIVSLHNGELSLKSELDKGSEFIIKIPLLQCL